MKTGQNKVVRFVKVESTTGAWGVHAVFGGSVNARFDDKIGNVALVRVEYFTYGKRYPKQNWN